MGHTTFGRRFGTDIGLGSSPVLRNYSLAVQDLMKRSEIESDKKIGRLSKGVKRRLAFALVAATGSELILDEPTAGVDPFARRELLEDIS